jgi:hypothetical protein
MKKLLLLLVVEACLAACKKTTTTTPSTPSNAAQPFIITMQVFYMKTGDTVSYNVGGIGCSQQWVGKSTVSSMKWSGTYTRPNNPANVQAAVGNIEIKSWQSYGTGDSIVARIYLNGVLKASDTAYNYIANWIDYQ